MRKSIIVIMAIGAFIIHFTPIVNGTQKTYLSAKDSLRVDDFKIMGLYLGQPITEALKTLGKPQKVETAKITGECERYYYYPQIRIGASRVLSKKVGYISITKKSIKTFRGIEIGSSENEVIKCYGKTAQEFNSLIYEKEYDPSYSGYSLGIRFVIEKGKVKEIIISFLSTT